MHSHGDERSDACERRPSTSCSDASSDPALPRFSSGLPVVVDALCDPSVPPLPPHISVKQARAFVSALRKGDPHGRDVITQSFKEKILEFLPGR